MSYVKTNWIDHIIDPTTGNIVQQGTKFTSTRANKFEQGIEDAHKLVESLAENVVGSSVISGLSFSASGLTANYTAGIAYVNGVRFEVAASSLPLAATQGQFIYLDSDGLVKTTTTQSTAEAKCLLWYFATDASAVITSNDRKKKLGVVWHSGNFNPTTKADLTQVVRADATTTMNKTTELKKIANNDGATYTIIDADAKLYRAVYNDLAELFEHKEPSEPGDILVSVYGNVEKSSIPYDKRVVGVHSDTFGICLGGENKTSPQENYDKYTPIGISGRVFTKVIGDIEEGDLITASDIPGVGMKAENYLPGTVVGKALETCKNTQGIYRVQMLIMNL
ncbi:hypothetical protein [Brevibacillus sp. SYSU BS000544]|uniref:hypothetical protein n=1 Tax=Brevibacillus sp. SYSU BS000544 TaxID=3416443 RepID=UPI003CE4563B